MTETESSVPCSLGDWSTWTECPQECLGGSFQERTRVILNGSCSDPLYERRPCNSTQCKVCTITYDTYVELIGDYPPADGKFYAIVCHS